MKHNTNISIEDYNGDDALDLLLTDLSFEALDLVQNMVQELPKGRDWLVVDIHRTDGGYGAVVVDTQTLRLSKYPIAAEYQAIHLALDYDLVMVEVLITCLHPSHATHPVPDVLRRELTRATRTPRSKKRGFRWDLKKEYRDRAYMDKALDDVVAMAKTITRETPGEKVDNILIAHERILVDTTTGANEYPFDHYPFLGVLALEDNDGDVSDFYIGVLNDQLEVNERENDEIEDFLNSVIIPKNNSVVPIRQVYYHYKTWAELGEGKIPVEEQLSVKQFDEKVQELFGHNVVLSEVPETHTVNVSGDWQIPEFLQRERYVDGFAFQDGK